MDVHKLIRQLLPVFLRKPVRIAWLEALLAPFAAMWAEYAGWRTEKYYEANVTAQTISMEAWLNRRFDPVEKRIRIQHGEDEGVYVSLRSEGYDEEFYIDGEQGAFIALEGEQENEMPFGFTVKIPPALAGISYEIEGVVRNIKAAGVSFELIIESGLYRPETDSLLSRMHQQPSADICKLIDKTISDLQEAGIWDLVKRLYCRRAHTLQAALLDWKGLSDGMAHNAVGFRAGYGIRGDGISAYIDNGWSPSEVLAPNACGLFFEAVTNATLGSGILGSADNSDDTFMSMLDTASGCFTASINTAIASPSAAINSVASFWAAQRASAIGASNNYIRWYRNGNYSASRQNQGAGGALPQAMLTSLSLNSSGTVSNYSDIELGWEGYSDVLTDRQQATLYQIISYYNRNIVSMVTDTGAEEELFSAGYLKTGDYLSPQSFLKS